MRKRSGGSRAGGDGVRLQRCHAASRDDTSKAGAAESATATGATRRTLTPGAASVRRLSVAKSVLQHGARVAEALPPSPVSAQHECGMAASHHSATNAGTAA